MVLLETGELLLDKDATTVVEVVSREVLKALHALPPGKAHLLNVVPLLEVHEAEHAADESQPERAVLHEVHVLVVVNRM